MWGSLVIVLTLTAPARITHPGPMTVPWGTGIITAHEKFTQRLTLQEYEREGGSSDLQPNTPEKPLSHAGESGFTLEYTGAFGGFDENEIKDIEVGFDEKKRLASFCVSFSKEDEQPKALTFDRVVETMNRAYGAPDKIETPKRPTPRMRDVAIKSGNAESKAFWKFKDGTLVFVAVNSSPNAEGVRELGVLWCALSKSAKKDLSKSTDL